MLTVVNGLEKFHYTHRREVTVPTDHKTLILINQKPLSKAPKQLQNLHVYTEIQLYTQVQAKKGSSIGRYALMSPNKQARNERFVTCDDAAYKRP